MKLNDRTSLAQFFFFAVALQIFCDYDPGVGAVADAWLPFRHIHKDQQGKFCLVMLCCVFFFSTRKKMKEKINGMRRRRRA